MWVHAGRGELPVDGAPEPAERIRHAGARPLLPQRTDTPSAQDTPGRGRLRRDAGAARHRLLRVHRVTHRPALRNLLGRRSVAGKPRRIRDRTRHHDRTPRSAGRHRGGAAISGLGAADPCTGIPALRIVRLGPPLLALSPPWVLGVADCRADVSPQPGHFRGRVECDVHLRLLVRHLRSVPRSDWCHSVYRRLRAAHVREERGRSGQSRGRE